MRFILILSHRTSFLKCDRRSLLFSVEIEEEIDLLQDLCNEWNERNTYTFVELFPTKMAIQKHNAENDSKIVNELGLMMYYRAKKVDLQDAINLLTVENADEVLKPRHRPPGAPELLHQPDMGGEDDPPLPDPVHPADPPVPDRGVDGD